jgi:flagellar biosynthesis protein FliQ
MNFYRAPKTIFIIISDVIFTAALIVGIGVSVRGGFLKSLREFPKTLVPVIINVIGNVILYINMIFERIYIYPARSQPPGALTVLSGFSESLC